MFTTVTIDKAGRVVIPKDVREALRLTPGTLLRLEHSGDQLTLAPAIETARLVIEHGTPLVFPADTAGKSILTLNEANELVEQIRAKRERRMLGLDEAPEESD